MVSQLGKVVEWSTHKKTHPVPGVVGTQKCITLCTKLLFARKYNVPKKLNLEAFLKNPKNAVHALHLADFINKNITNLALIM